MGSGLIRIPIGITNADQRVFTYYTKRPQTAADSVPTAWSAPDAHGESISGHYQRYTLNRVAHVIASQKEEPDSLVESTYSYDPHGNVEWVRQELPILGSNWVEYSYDLLSGNMLEMRYNPGWRDALWHRYYYDEDNRLTEVKTSREGEIWDSDARYIYYPHGPLRRAEYGEDSLQGIDYTYTLQGWLKGVNHPQGALDLSSFGGGSGPYGFDPGGDRSGDRTNTAPDAFGMTLRYHEGDFYRVGSAFHSEESTADAAVAATNLPAIAVNGSATDLYNGNISTWTSHTVAAGGQVDETLTGHRYQYDVLNRLRLSRYEKWNGASVAPQGARYRSTYSYDPNGNIRSLVRYGNAISPFDNFTYTYPSAESNRLSQVSDAVTGPTAVVGDLEGGQQANNYTYDASGNLIGDTQELIASGGIEWRADGKVWRVTKSGGTPDELKVSYNASGDRVIKKVTDNGDERRLYYVREAGGKVLAVYEQQCEPPYTEAEVLALDSDGDGKPDWDDNCPCTYNPQQTDEDGDGAGVPCDLDDNVVGPRPDFDGDGNDDGHDNCPCEYNPSSNGQPNGPQPDSDGNNVGDACDRGCEMVLIELHIYGNGSEGRIAISQPSGITRGGPRGDTAALEDLTIQPPPPTPIYLRDSILTRVLAEKVYELKDHLGNVRVVISDVKAPAPQAGEAPFAVTLRRYTNYYPFGMAQPGRSYEGAGGEYRYSYNGQERDGEWLGGQESGSSVGELVSFRFRQHDTRTARFLSVDPLAMDYPANSTYSYAQNSPVSGRDLEGLEYYYSADGRFLGRIGRSAAVGIADRIDVQNGVAAPVNPTVLDMDHSSFAKIANIVMHEASSSGPSTESLYLAHTMNNHAKAVGRSLLSTVTSSYTSVPSTAKQTQLSTENGSNRAKFARAGVLSVLRRDDDPTGGAEFWDGVDFLAWGMNSPNGTPHNKFEEYSRIVIPYAVFAVYYAALADRFPNGPRYYGKRYSLPADVFKREIAGNQPLESLVLEGAANRTHELIATRAAGSTIFWRIQRNMQGEPSEGNASEGENSISPAGEGSRNLGGGSPGSLMPNENPPD